MVPLLLDVTDRLACIRDLTGVPLAVSSRTGDQVAGKGATSVTDNVDAYPTSLQKLVGC
jgi:hypothetical protein